MPASNSLAEAPLSFTAKSGKGYDADMLTIRAATFDGLEELGREVYGEDVWDEKIDQLRKVPQDAAGGPATPSGGGGASSSGGEAWKANPPTCDHGTMEPRQWVGKSGVNKGKDQYTFFCPQPREVPQDQKCTPVDAISRKAWGS